MSAGKIIGYIFAAILIIFGVLYILASSNPSQEPGIIFTGVIMVLIGFGIIWFVGKKLAPGDEEVKVQIDLTGDIELDTLTCKSCGGHLSSEHTSLQEGALVVDCPFCGTNYQIIEKPKW
jgi:vacuolar-type H+-ATPase subunit I/STV1